MTTDNTRSLKNTKGMTPNGDRQIKLYCFTSGYMACGGQVLSKSPILKSTKYAQKIVSEEV